MSYTQPGSHLASISRDPLDTGYEGSSYRGPSSRNRRSLSDYSQPWSGPETSDMVRPLLLAGALGLFAAWVVSGMDFNRSSSRRPTRGQGYVPGDDAGMGGYRSRQKSYGSAQRNDRFGGSTPPEGRSPVRDFELDAMNP